MTYEDTLQRINDMKSRFDDGFSSIDRSYLDSIYYYLFSREITNKGCSDCYRDAYIEITHYLSKHKTMPEKSVFVLKAGAIITFFGESKCYSNANITDEVALRYLSLNPNNQKMFSSLPKDWEELVAEYTANGEVKKEDASDTTEKDAIIAQLTAEVEALKAEIETLKSSKGSKSKSSKTKSEEKTESVASEAVDESKEDATASESTEVEEDPILDEALNGDETAE